MPERRLPAVGFDRFLKLEWMDYALDLALMGKPPELLREWLSSQVPVYDTLRKTNSLLMNLWLTPYPETQHLLQQGIDLARQTPLEDRLILHWGMALANFSLFRTTARTMGRLLRLHGQFSTQEIVRRVLEQHSNASTVGRAIARILQSMASWGVVHSEAGRYHITAMRLLSEPRLSEWLLEAVLITSGKHSWPMVDLLRANELFPLELSQQAMMILHTSKHFTLSREGLDQEIVTLNTWKRETTTKDYNLLV
jgi:hypothetical protein